MGQFVEVAPYEPPIGMTEVDSPSLLYDADSNRFDGIRVHDRNNGNINWYLITMTAPDGRALRAWEVRRPGWKHSNGTFFWSGNDLIVMLTGYELVPKPRPNGKDFTRIPGVFNAGRLMEEAGGAGGWAGNAEEGGGEPVDYEQIRQIVRAEIAGWGNPQVSNIVNNIRPKVGAELQDRKVVTEAMFDTLEQGGSTIVAQRIENEAYEGARNALRTEATEPEEPAEPTEGGTKP